MSIFKWVFAVLLTLWVSNLVSAVPIRWELADGGNGNFYDFVVLQSNWSGANAAAQSMSFNSFQGQLATITSQEELEFIRQNANPFTGSFWLGGFQDTNAPDYGEPDGGWRWVGGEPFIFTNWSATEPNDDGGGENFLEGATVGGVSLLWNDLDASDLRGGFYIEYVPEPSTLALSALGLVGLLAHGWRRRRRT